MTINPLNYATLEAAQRLAEKGIVLETDYYWVRIEENKWSLQPKDNETEHDLILGIAIPAPSLAEVWRELPEKITYDGRYYFPYLIIRGCLFAGYCDSDEITLKDFADANPTDALIDLLIWVVEQKGKGAK